ncbi:MAG: SMC-Scp complex subunit ScpB [Candidatus Latescibacterota bacterium]
MEHDQVKSIVEALLFATDVPLSPDRLESLVGSDPPAPVREVIAHLNQEYWEQGRAFLIAEVGGGFQMTTRTQYGPWVKKLFLGRTESRLSPAALETLAIIAFKQPVVRAEIQAIRGVDSGGVLATLLDRGLIRIAGRSEALGRPLRYGTTKKFLRHFGLNVLSDLPKPKEIEDLIGQERRGEKHVEDKTEQVAGPGGDRLPQEVRSAH